MQIRIGYELTYQCAQTSPILLTLNVHPSRSHDLLAPDMMRNDRDAPMKTYADGFGNIITRVLAPPGAITFTTDAVVHDSGEPDPVVADAIQHPIEELPDHTLVYLLGSRYCETDRLSEFAWSQFGHVQGGWARVQAVCDYAHARLTFDYQRARSTRTAYEGNEERVGVCRDFAHLATALCRCMNIPARYCTGYLGDIGVPLSDSPMDFSGWFEAYVGGRWYTFDARHNAPRIGRILIAQGRDAADVAISNTFGNTWLSGFKVVTDEVV